MKKLLSLSLLVVLVASTMFVGCPGKESIVIGAVMPLSGDGAVYGEPQKLAAELAVERINAEGGLLGKKLVLDAQDDKAEPAEATKAAQYFTSKGDVVGVIGHPNSGNAIPASKIYHDKGMPYVASSPTNPTLTQQGFGNVFRFAPTDAMQGVSGAEFIFETLGSKTLAIVHDNAAYGKGLADEVKKRFEQLGGKVLLFDAIAAREKDYRSVLTKISRAKPNAVYYGGMLPEGAVLVRQMKELGINVPIVFGDGCFDEKLKELAGTDCRNVFVSFLAPPWDQLPSAKEFVEAYQAKHGPVPSFAPYGYDAVIVLAKAVEKAGSTDHDRVVAALADPGFRVSGATGEISFGPDGQSADRRFYFYTFNDEGKLVLME